MRYIRFCGNHFCRFIYFHLVLVWTTLQTNLNFTLLQGIEKKTAKLKGSEKAVVARHEAGHAVVGTAVANLLTGQPRVEVAIALH